VIIYKQDSSNAYVAPETSTKFVLHADNIKFNAKNEECIIIGIILPLYFSVHHVQ
jgi:hypothetical protein